MKTEQPNENTKRTGRADSRILEWTYEEGPPRRSWRWYILVLLIGLGGAGLLALVAPSDPAWALGMVLWTTIVLAFALAPSRVYTGQLDRNLLYIWDIKRNRAVLEQNLAEFATWKIDEIPADRLNPMSRKLILRQKNGRAAREIRLTGDDIVDAPIVARVAEAVALAPDIAPTFLERFDKFAAKWIGWR